MCVPQYYGTWYIHHTVNQATTPCMLRYHFQSLPDSTFNVIPAMVEVVRPSFHPTLRLASDTVFFIVLCLLRQGVKTMLRIAIHKGAWCSAVGDSNTIVGRGAWKRHLQQQGETAMTRPSRVPADVMLEPSQGVNSFHSPL